MPIHTYHSLQGNQFRAGNCIDATADVRVETINALAETPQARGQRRVPEDFPDLRSSSLEKKLIGPALDQKGFRKRPLLRGFRLNAEAFVRKTDRGREDTLQPKRDLACDWLAVSVATV